MKERPLFAIKSREESEVLVEFFRRTVTSMKLNGASEARLRFPPETNIPGIRISFIDEDQNG